MGATMISDTLSEAVNEIDRYLNDPLYAGMYGGDLRKRIVAVRDQMHALRAELDAPPDLEFQLPPQEEVPGKITIDETNLVINKRTGAFGLQFKVSFKPESGE